MSSSSSQMKVNHKKLLYYLRDTVVTYKYKMGRKQKKKLFNQEKTAAVMCRGNWSIYWLDIWDVCLFVVVCMEAVCDSNGVRAIFKSIYITRNIPTEIQNPFSVVPPFILLWRPDVMIVISMSQETGNIQRNIPFMVLRCLIFVL